MHVCEGEMGDRRVGVDVHLFICMHVCMYANIEGKNVKYELY